MFEYECFSENYPFHFMYTLNKLFIIYSDN